MNAVFSQVMMTMIFIAAVYFHLAKKNISLAVMYGVQSLAVVALLVASFLERGSLSLLLVALVTLVVKVILAPTFFVRLINRHQLKLIGNFYLNAPLSLVVVAFISAAVNSRIFAPVTRIAAGHEAYLSLALSAMLISIFLMINRRSVLSQIVGILSLENSIVAFAIFAGLEQSATLQLGIMFDIFVWLMIATVFTSMIYKHFGSLDITAMKHLKD